MSSIVDDNAKVDTAQIRNPNLENPTRFDIADKDTIEFYRKLVS